MQKTQTNILALICLCLLSVSLLCLSACSQPTPEPELETEVIELGPQYRIIGGQNDSALELEVTNATNLEIVGFAIGYSGSDVYGPSIVTKTTKIVVNETVCMFIDLSDADAALTDAVSRGVETTAAEGSGSGSDIILRDLYNIALTFTDDTVLVLHDLFLPDLTSIRIEISPDGFAYVKFTAKDGSSASTLESEKALILAEAERLAEEARIAAELEAQAQAEAEAAAQSAYNYDYSYSYGSSSGSQSADTCVQDLIFN